MFVSHWLAPVVAALLLSRADAALPEPPRQREPWQAMDIPDAPGQLPGVLAMLFEAGLADPRGGEYRQVELDRKPEGGRTKSIRGWYFPDGFAVGWDGMVHRVRRTGEKQDVRSDVLAVLERGLRDGNPTVTVTPGAVAVALLLRLGEVELARQMYLASKGAPYGGLSPGVMLTIADPSRNRIELFRSVARAWLSGIYHQAVEAHAVGDDRVAVEIAEWLIRARAAVDLSWKRLELPPWAATYGESVVEFLDPVPQLRADSERRLKQPLRAPFDEREVLGLPQRARIARLIERLEDVNERQWGQPGGVHLMGSPICRMLAAEGAEAVEPLVDVLDRDQRLTRSYSYARTFFPERYLIPVARTAEAILRAHYVINFPVLDPVKRREWLLRNKYRTLAERAFDLLADDTNDEAHWMEGARTLLQANKQGIGRVGEELRSRQEPSVSALLSRRAMEIKTGTATEMAFLLYQWEPTAALLALQRITRQGLRGSLWGRVFAARIELGDAAAAGEYATAMHGNQMVALDDLAPLWTAPDNDQLQSVARRLFLDPEARMSPLSVIGPGNPQDPFRQPLLLRNPVFRQSLLQGLGGKEAVGSVERFADGGRQIRAGDFSSWSGGGGKAYAPVKHDIRLGDYLAWRLSDVKGFPSFDLEWPLEERNRGIARIAEHLQGFRF